MAVISLKYDLKIILFLELFLVNLSQQNATSWLQIDDQTYANINCMECDFTGSGQEQETKDGQEGVMANELIFESQREESQINDNHYSWRGSLWIDAWYGFLMDSYGNSW